MRFYKFSKLICPKFSNSIRLPKLLSILSKFYIVGERRKSVTMATSAERIKQAIIQGATKASEKTKESMEQGAEESVKALERVFEQTANDASVHLQKTIVDSVANINSIINETMQEAATEVAKIQSKALERAIQNVAVQLQKKIDEEAIAITEKQRRALKDSFAEIGSIQQRYIERAAVEAIEIRKSHPISESYSVFLVEDKNRINFLTQAGGSFVLLASSLTNSKWPVDLVNKSAKTKVQIPICRQMGLNSGHLKVGVKSVDLYNLGKGFLASRAFQKCDEAQHFS
ncbi:uncharacterized protein LOC113469560 [Diaphorina citri]|uniref:Uncharacterized protein LOC113469560 n=1 Tax=Diaphorina citri TaxID=121845 RepID=A0A3Q0J894_DIACI|nr:uncharacterized protein LOC113469560 [Diaphorina citri]